MWVLVLKIQQVYKLLCSFELVIGEIRGTIHKNVMQEFGYALCVGAVLELTQVKMKSYLNYTSIT